MTWWICNSTVYKEGGCVARETLYKNFVLYKLKFKGPQLLSILTGWKTATCERLTKRIKF